MEYKFKKLAKKDYMKFYNSLKDARQTNKHGLFVLLRDPDVYKTTKNFLLGDGVAGFAITEDGEMISVHKNNDKAKAEGVHHVLPSLVACGFKNGALKGDCYGEFLADYYMSCGFLPVCCIAFDDLSDNPSNWDFDSFGRPNDYMFIKGVKNNKELARVTRLGLVPKFEDIKSKLHQFKTYEEALAYQDSMQACTRTLPYEQTLITLYQQ